MTSAEAEQAQPKLLCVPLSAPRFRVAHAVLQFSNRVYRDPGRDETFIAAVEQEFPNVLSRTFLPPEAPLLTPYVTLASTSSQLSLSTLQADFEVRFYGDYVTDVERALEYVERKLDAVLRAFASVDVAVETIGVIGTLHFSTMDDNLSPAQHILRTHLRPMVDESSVQDAIARVAVKVRDTYFVTLTISNYESRVMEQALMPGVQALPMRPWDGLPDDVGLELVLDINNHLESRVSHHRPRVTIDGVRATTRLLREIATSTGPTFAETGKISMRDLEASSAS